MFTHHARAAVTAILTATTLLTGITAAGKASTTAQQITVNLADDTGPVFHGASGALYGLSENGVPGADAIAPLHIRAIDAKPPGGLQHPTGDADKIAPEFVRAGGQWILVYMQDIYSAWPYQNLGLSDYLPRVETIVRELMATPQASHFAFVPFNEPDWIWYGLSASSQSQYIANRDRFLADWTTVYHAIKSIDPGAPIAGPNEAYYDSRFMPDFLSYAKAHNVLPQIISWHELSPSSLRTYRSSYASFRALERQDGIGPLPVDIDEYANRYDLSVPGEMVQWLSMFEDTKVYAAMPFWDIADNYSDTVVRNDEPNGQWWLLYWYGQLTGHTVGVTVPQPNMIDTPAGLAALDTSRRQARILVADPGGSGDSVTITGIGRRIFGDRVHVSVQSIGWSGYDGAAYTPVDAAETDYRVTDGSVTVPLGGTDPMSAYQLIVTPAREHVPGTAVTPGTRTYLAADASLTDATVYSQGSVSNPNGYATAGGKDVGSIDQPDSRVAFQVTAPRTGRYFLSVYYGNQTGTIAQQIMRVDSGPWSFVSYPPTLNWLFRSHQDMYLNLTAGTHTITFGVSDPSTGTAKGQVTLDDIQLTYAPGDVPGVTGPATSYPAAYADVSGDATTFAVDAGHDGYYRLSLGGARGDLRAAIGDSRGVAGNHLSFRTSNEGTVAYLHAGINPVRVADLGTGGTLNVTPDPAADAADTAVYAAAAPGNALSGTAVVQADPYAYGGADVGYVGNGAGNTLTFTGIRAPRAGVYRVMVSYADNDRAGSGNYNSNLIDRGFTVSTSSGSPETVYARNTYSWDQFDTVEVTVRLGAGLNTITFGNPDAYAPNFDKITVAAAVLP
ncbi:MAG: hypothetical protein JOY82_04060 [Streptosporangiaceae bacterium]|nr:hypothetical protein [Streptosporangiaceae bacterium]MBV9853687.1 hypothetical protein [Streptosporangiaceae bacterium]